MTKSAPSWPGGRLWAHGGASQDGTLRMGQVGRWGGECARAHVLACGGVRACVRETVCAITFVSVFLERCSSWSWDRRWASRFRKTGGRDKRQEAGRYVCQQQVSCPLLSRRKLKWQDIQWYVPPLPLPTHPPLFFFNQTEHWNEKHKAKNHTGRLNSWLLCHLSTAFNRRRKGSPCYTISYWLAVINRDRQHASSIPINCSKQEWNKLGWVNAEQRRGCGKQRLHVLVLSPTTELIP